MIGAGTDGGFGVAVPAAAAGPVGPVKAALTTIDLAFVELPWTGMAPFSKIAPSVGWSTVSVGASTARNGTVMNLAIDSSERLPVSGSSELTSNSFRPRRNSTSAFHAPDASALTL